MADFAVDANDLTYARALFMPLVDGADRQQGIYARFMLAFIDYAEGAYRAALNRGFEVYETLKANRDAYPVLAPEILPLITLAAVRIKQPPSSVRLYLRAQGGGELERNYLPLLAAALQADGQWSLAAKQYATLLAWRRPEESDADRQEWVLAQLRIDYQLARYEDIVSAVWSKVAPCTFFEGSPNRRGQCLVILGRTLTKLKAYDDAKVVLSRARRLGEYPNSTTDVEPQNWKYESWLRFHDLGSHLVAHRASSLTIPFTEQSLRRAVKIYENFLDSAPSHWQAIAYDRLARLYEIRAKTSPNTRKGRVNLATAEALRERGGIRLNTSPKGIDWMLKHAP